MSVVSSARREKAGFFSFTPDCQLHSMLLVHLEYLLVCIWHALVRCRDEDSVWAQVKISM